MTDTGNGPGEVRVRLVVAAPQIVPPPLSVTGTFGLTVIEVVNGVAAQVFAAVGVTLKVTVCWVLVVFTSVEEGIVPVPLAAIPVTFSVFVRVHEKLAPAILLLKVMADMVPPEQIVVLGLVAEVTSLGFTVTVIFETQPPAVEAIAYL